MNSFAVSIVLADIFSKTSDVVFVARSDVLAAGDRVLWTYGAER